MLNTIAGLIQQFFRLFIWWVFVSPWERAVRVRSGKHVSLLMPGAHWRVPVLDKIFLQTIRRRTTMLNVQTLATKSGKTVTLSGVLTYRIDDLLLLYQTLHHAEDTLRNDAMAIIADHVYGADDDTCSPTQIQAAIGDSVASAFQKYGIAEAQIRITSFCFVKTFRIIQDGQWGNHDDALKMNADYLEPTAK